MACRPLGSGMRALRYRVKTVKSSRNSGVPGYRAGDTGRWPPRPILMENLYASPFRHLMHCADHGSPVRLRRRRRQLQQFRRWGQPGRIGHCDALQRLGGHAQGMMNMTHTTHSTIGLSLRRAGALAAALTLSTLAAAAPPAGSPYATDAQNSHVFDETSHAIQQVNTVTCYMSSMRPDLMVNKGNYIALVNQTHCDPNSSASGSAASSGGSSAPSYQPVIVNSTRASGSDPMKAGVWIDQ